MTIEKLNELGITPNLVYRGLVATGNYDDLYPEEEELLDKYKVTVVNQSDYPDEIYQILNDSYYGIPYYIVIEVDEYDGSRSWFKAECIIGSYIDEWDNWKEVSQKEKIVTYYE